MLDLVSYISLELFDGVSIEGTHPWLAPGSVLHQVTLTIERQKMALSTDVII